MRRRLSLAVGIALTAALVGLAWLQYQWITRVADAERDRLGTFVANGARQISDEFDREISQVLRALAAGPPDLAAFTDRCLLFHNTRIGEGRLVQAIYAVDGESLQRFDPSQKRFVAVSWPAPLANLRDRMEGGRPPRALIVDPDIPAIALVRSRPPALRPRDAEEAPPDGPRPNRPLHQMPHQWSIVEFDRSYITTTWLPELAGRLLSASETSDLGIRIMAADSPDPVLALNAAGIDFSHPLAVAPLFSRRIFVQGGFAPPGPPGGPPQRGMGGMGGPGAGPWRIEVKHRAGSLEQAVAHTRRNNLLVSGATLVLMAAALAVILVSTRRAEALAHAQMEFVAGVSHELRTPLSVICSAADNLADGVVQNEQSVKRYGSVIRQEGRRLASMVEQILRFAGIQSGRARYERQPVQVLGVIAAAVGGSADAVHRSGCTLDQSVPEGLPEVFADPTALTHALRNLIENAAVHGASGGWIGVSAVAREAAVEIAVADRGPGIPAGDRQRIFDPFFRGARALENQVRGFGLGLALVRRIVEAHDGSVQLETGPGGSCFRILIPKVKA